MQNFLSYKEWYETNEIQKELLKAEIAFDYLNNFSLLSDLTDREEFIELFMTQLYESMVNDSEGVCDE